MNTSIPQKCCSACKEWKPATLEVFCSSKSKKDGLNCYCKECMSAKWFAKHPKDDIPEGYKRCTQCEQSFPANPIFFSRATREKDGLYYCCKACNRVNRAAKYPPKIIDIIPEGYKRCTKCKTAYIASYAFFCNDRHSPNGLTLWCKSCIAHYRQQHREEHRQYCSQYSKEHRTELTEYSRTYLKTYNQRPGVQERQRIQSCVRSKQRRARKKKVPGTLTQEQIQQKLELQRFRCYYCHDKFEMKGSRYVFHLEHTIPISRIEHNPRHDINYVVLSCPTCNLKKWNKLPHEWPEGGRLF